jgi:late competence protein required for DNA uptake (superfamily II DNA/RNA helicase)
MALVQARFKLEAETKGAVRYQEVNDKGEPEQMREKIGALYIRKTAFERGASFPQVLIVTIEAVPEKEEPQPREEAQQARSQLRNL